MTEQAHWDAVYGSKAATEVSWYRPHLETSLALIERAGGKPGSALIDVGGGEATLVDDLLQRGYRDLSVLDISAAALAATRQRLGRNAEQVQWWEADITRAKLPAQRYDIWHDRAVFHFLTRPEQRAAYVQALQHALRPQGQLILATFGPEGPEKCSGLPVVRYDAASLQAALGEGFRLKESLLEWHDTPWGSRQQFLYCRYRPT